MCEIYLTEELGVAEEYLVRSTISVAEKAEAMLTEIGSVHGHDLGLAVIQVLKDPRSLVVTQSCSTETQMKSRELQGQSVNLMFATY